MHGLNIHMDRYDDLEFEDVYVTESPYMESIDVHRAMEKKFGL